MLFIFTNQISSLCHIYANSNFGSYYHIYLKVGITLLIIFFPSDYKYEYLLIISI